MPRLPIDYKKSIIYKIVCKTDESLIYIGSTTDFTKRKNSHKSHCNNENRNVYQMIRANGGWTAFDMKPVKEYPCENKIQLLIEEERIRKEFNANLNKIRAYRTEEEEKEQEKKHQKTYNETHKEQIKEQKKSYYEANKEKLKAYSEANKEQIKERRKAYREANKEQIKEKAKAYRKQQKELV